MEHVGERLELPGFRKGKAPVEMVKSNVPEMETRGDVELALGEKLCKSSRRKQNRCNWPSANIYN